MPLTRFHRFDRKKRLGTSQPPPSTLSAWQGEDLSVVIPSYNACSLLRKTLLAVVSSLPKAEVIVVDGSSQDGSPEMVLREFPGVHLIRVTNHGFAHATNQGLEKSTRPLILLLNSDVFVTFPALLAMRERLSSNPKIGAVGPRLLNEDGSRQWLFGPFYWPNWVNIYRPTRVWLLSAACLMTRRDVLEAVGGLDESFFLYNEEYDWCLRVAKQGFLLELLPHGVIHVGGGSTSPHPSLILEAQRGFVYLASKHAPKSITNLLRHAMLLEGFCYSRLDPRREYRQMWAHLESIMRRRAYTESPFPLSGRGDRLARPQSLSFPSTNGNPKKPIHSLGSHTQSGDEKPAPPACTYSATAAP
ncbi:MAG: glycosyltransferase family 2 protein [Deltaproteobacteria bacterium]|nr:glycosyltransferase family 2 protein [Deltaproteobacteria bacterium]